MRAFLGLIRQDLRLGIRQGGDIGLVLGFFVLAVILFPFGIGPEPELLRRVAAGIVWVAALLAAVLSLDRLFATDYADGGLDLIALSAMPLELAVLAKAAAHWLTTGLPLVIVSPLLAILVDLDPAALPSLVVGLLLGTPAMSLVGAIAAALSLGARRPGVLTTLVVLPLYLPPLIFGTGAVEASLAAEGARAHLLLLAALSVAAVPLAPLAAAAALRQALD
ncbi:MAG: heme exporter protein CcmB [Alphaproteobacteria bacterium 13_1_20CM_3_64_12]|jgi:heme exporter protein B|nr:MAG: heme exporter protein CcmB [Alphaproteobacteria bacterium 13_1_20CM_3_64_12]TMJ78784.1 MAG: heme exporter protein CcmB [Alphaproteobacteria bacterium]TMK12862.1 MAG: heme exporter protein CcmB [Alphaproteobacteria bacterium]